MTKTELVTLIKECIKEELKSGKTVNPLIKRYVQIYVPVVVKEMVDDAINESLVALNEQKAVSPKKRTNLRPALTESTQVEDEEEFGFSTTLTYDSRDAHEIMSRPSPGNAFAGRNTITEIATEAGVTRPVPQSAIPPYLRKALNTDYRSFLRDMNGVPKGQAGYVPLEMGLGREDVGK